MQPKIPRRVVAELTADAFGVSMKDLRSCSRNRTHTKARFAVWHMVREFRPETSLKELGNLLAKDHTTVVNGLVRAKEFSCLNREFGDGLHRARRNITQWRPGSPVAAEPLVSLVHVAPKVETPPAVKSEPAKTLRSLSRAPESCGGFEYDAWFRNSLKDSEAQFLAIAMAEHPERVRVPVREAAE